MASRKNNKVEIFFLSIFYQLIIRTLFTALNIKNSFGKILRKIKKKKSLKISIFFREILKSFPEFSRENYFFKLGLKIFYVVEVNYTFCFKSISLTVFSNNQIQKSWLGGLIFNFTAQYLQLYVSKSHIIYFLISIQ